ncbi:hypothetical protein QR685DRAFT_524596 [Neurospora intermedia]|uniref:Uncharacterized protein n=1 Tax=Neurospora intermedia TaxID=5142 RepID=A0ABR3DDN9_NEUIN
MTSCHLPLVDVSQVPNSSRPTAEPLGKTSVLYGQEFLAMTGSDRSTVRKKIGCLFGDVCFAERGSGNCFHRSSCPTVR